jgi:ubiquinone/menaquinone biosynthesis C-methylase UbiE
MKSNTEWKYWGKQDPLYGVAAWEGREIGGDNPWTEDDFYQLGVLDWEDFYSHWQRYGVKTGLCVEIGCGAGRLTRPLAEVFEQLAALDISPEMIAWAQSRVSGPHVSYYQVEDTAIPLPAASADAVFSTHVFQHFEERGDVAAYFGEIARVLKPGGSLMIHIPVHAWPAGAGGLSRSLYRARKYAQKIKAAIKRQLIRHGVRSSLMRMNSYEISWLYRLLQGLDFTDVEISVFVTRSNGHPHPFVMARRAGPAQASGARG